MLPIREYSSDEITRLLREHGVVPTQQRVDIGRALFANGGHFSADAIYTMVNKGGPVVSKATVYNTLGLFVERRLIREVIIDPTRVFYDANTDAHHHFYDVMTGMLTDIPAHEVVVQGLPAVPTGKRITGIDVVVRVAPTDVA